MSKTKAAKTAKAAKPAKSAGPAKPPKPAKPAGRAQSPAFPPVILVHGFRGSPEGLADAQAELELLSVAAGTPLEIHFPALPPSATAGPLAEYTADTFADWLADYIRTQRLQKPLLVGHSMGSLVVTATASKYPELINQHLLLLAPVSQPTPRPIAALQPLVAVLPNRAVTYITTKYLFAHAADSPEATQAIFDRAMALSRAGGAAYQSHRELARAAKFSANATVGDFPLRPSQKVHLIIGDQDKLFKRGATEALARAWQAELLVIPNCGHLLNYERPQALGQAIWSVLQQIVA